MTFTVGLTGGIGSGKTTVARIFADHKVGIIDADVIAHTLTAEGGIAMPELEATFGTKYIQANGALNREMMRELAFSDPCARARLEAILHPLIRKHAREQIISLLGQHAYLICVVPLLLESNEWADIVHRVLVVDCSIDTQIRRVLKREQLNETQIRAIIASQAPREHRLRLADDVIHNDLDDTEALKKDVERFHQRYLQMAARFERIDVDRLV